MARFSEPTGRLVIFGAQVEPGLQQALTQGLEAGTQTTVRVLLAVKRGSIQMLGADPGQRVALLRIELRAIQQCRVKQFVVGQIFQRSGAKETFVGRTQGQPARLTGSEDGENDQVGESQLNDPVLGPVPKLDW